MSDNPVKCRHAYRWPEEPAGLPDCDLHVKCDDGCAALVDPQTVEELRAAVEHWRDHGYRCGCSHGC